MRVKAVDWNQRVKALGAAVGFDRVGVAAAAAIERRDYLRAWLEAGRAGSMAYLHRYAEQRTDPTMLLPGARSVVVTALSYHQPNIAAVGASGGSASPGAGRAGTRGRVARYAWGRDYHRVVRAKLYRVADALRRDAEAAGVGDQRTRVCVDTAPLLEREFAAAAGVGWIGKNTLVLDPQLGSYFFLGAIVTTLEIEPDPPAMDHCGTCTRCLDACPTAAFPAAYQMDASRCISYLTIEHRGDIPAEFGGQTGEWLFGCDVCQEVCPHNQGAAATREPDFAVRPPSPMVDLRELLDWTDEDYRRELAGSAMKRATLPMLKRNARRILQDTGLRPPGSP